MNVIREMKIVECGECGAEHSAFEQYSICNSCKYRDPEPEECIGDPAFCKGEVEVWYAGIPRCRFHNEEREKTEERIRGYESDVVPSWYQGDDYIGESFHEEPSVGGIGDGW